MVDCRPIMGQEKHPCWNFPSNAKKFVGAVNHGFSSAFLHPWPFHRFDSFEKAEKTQLLMVKTPSVCGDQSCFPWGHHFAMSTLLGLLHLLKIFKGWTMSHVPLGLKIKSQASLLGWPLTGRWLRWSFVICKKRTSKKSTNPSKQNSHLWIQKGWISFHDLR